MAGEFLLRNFDIEKDEDKKKKGRYLLDNFKIYPVQAKPASNPKTNTYGPMQTSKTNALSDGFYQPKTGSGAVNTTVPASKAGAHRVRNTSFNSDPKSNTPQTYGPVQTTKEDAVSAGG